MPYNVFTERQHKPRSGVSLGGLGAGWFELRQDGTFENWNIFNNRPLGCGQPFPLNPHSILFFLIRYCEQGKTPRICLLQIEDSHGSAGIDRAEFQYIFPWLSGVDAIRYTATFPFIHLEFSERDMPLEVTLDAWSPFIPRDVKNSSLPVAFFDLRLKSKTANPIDVAILASQRNGVGYDVVEKAYSSRILDGATYRQFEQGTTHLPATHSSWGTMAVASLDPDSHCYTGWEHQHPYYENLLRHSLLSDKDDTAGRNKIDRASGKVSSMDRCFSTIGVQKQLAGEGTEWNHSFVMAWCFPNQYAKLPKDTAGAEAGYLEDPNFPGTKGPLQVAEAVTRSAHVEGHYYSNWFQSASEVAQYAIENRDHLLNETRRFHAAFYASTIPVEVLDQINSNLNTFRTSSWLTRAGDFGILEGLSPTRKFAGLSTVDVGMYGMVATSALFPDLDRSIIHSHRRLQNDNGSVLHSIDQNFLHRNPSEASAVRVDLPGQYAYLALRTFFWSGDRAYLEEVWPSVEAALDYILRERDANGDQIPDMAGNMSSYDNFPMYGVAPYVAFQWLAAVSLAAEAAAILGKTASEKKWRNILAKGMEVVDLATWNGSYYRLYNDGGRRDEGCLTDQLFGQWATHLVDLPGLAPTEQVRSALAQVMKRNYHDDQGLRNCQWPDDAFLHPVADDCWVDQANTCWTGVELAFASLLIYEGMVEDGLKVIRNVDARYRRWGIYWDHQEFGGHYFRPMSAWAIMPALLGAKVRDGTITFAPRMKESSLRLLFTTSHGYGHYVQNEEGISLEILSGELQAKCLRVAWEGTSPVEASVNGRTLPRAISERRGPLLEFRFDPLLTLHSGEQLTLKKLSS